MSRLLGKVIKSIAPYVPGEQIKGEDIIKLNTNESAYPPAPAVEKALQELPYNSLKLYPDPTAKELRETAADYYKVNSDQVFFGCGSDEVLSYAFMGFFNKGDKVYFPDISYGFYKVYSKLYQLNAVEIPLDKNFEINVSNYLNLDGGVVIANPNAPTGICLTINQVEEIVKSNLDNLVIIDEAYIDFSKEESAVSLIDKYDNLLVVQTFSKSRGLAGMRLGLGLGNKNLINGLERVKYSINPYNLDYVAQKVGVASLKNSGYMKKTTQKIVNTRETFSASLKDLGFSVVESQTNFVFVKPKGITGEDYYNKLREKNILVRYFSAPRLKDYVRITIGTPEDMKTLIEETKSLL